MHQGRPHFGEEDDYISGTGSGEPQNPSQPPQPPSNTGFMTLQDLLPEGLLDAYNTTGFEDLLGAQFDTSLLDITKQVGQDNIFNSIAQGQSSFMQVPGQEARAGASGFGNVGGGSRDLVTAQGAQRGLFGDVSEAMLGAKRADITALEGLKDRAFSMFSDIQLDLGVSGNSTDNNGAGTTNEGTNDTTWTFGEDGKPTESGTFGSIVENPVTGQVWSWVGNTWVDVSGAIPESTNNNNRNVPPQPPIGGGVGGGGGGCFLAGTMILTGDGTELPIEDIKKGMDVYAFDKESGELKVSKVSETFFHPKENTYLIINDDLLVTPNHPVLNNNKWVEIGELEEGDMLTDKDNNPIPINKIEEVKELSDVFNFEVEKYHTYVAQGIIVHNKNTEEGGGYGGEGGGKIMGDDYFWPTGG